MAVDIFVTQTEFGRHCEGVNASIKAIDGKVDGVKKDIGDLTTSHANILGQFSQVSKLGAWVLVVLSGIFLVLLSLALKVFSGL